MRANLLSDLGRQDEVIDVLTAGLENCPDSSILHFALAGALATAGKYEAALAECDAVLDGRSETDAVLLLRFFLLIKLSRYTEASMLLERVMEINPCEPYIFELLGHDIRTVDMPNVRLTPAKQHCPQPDAAQTQSILKRSASPN